VGRRSLDAKSLPKGRTGRKKLGTRDEILSAGRLPRRDDTRARIEMREGSFGRGIRLEDMCENEIEPSTRSRKKKATDPAGVGFKESPEGGRKANTKVRKLRGGKKGNIHAGKGNTVPGSKKREVQRRGRKNIGEKERTKLSPNPEARKKEVQMTEQSTKREDWQKSKTGNLDKENNNDGGEGLSESAPAEKFRGKSRD